MSNLSSLDYDDIQNSLVSLETKKVMRALVDDINVDVVSAKSTLYDDFLGTWLITDAGPADQWTANAGNGTNNQTATTVAASLCGEITLKTASDDGAITANMTAFGAIGLAWKANQGGLSMETRIKLDDVSEAYLFVGFTDLLVSGTLEEPLFMTADVVDSTATDACGLIYDKDSTTDNFIQAGVKAGTDTDPAFSGSAPSDGVYFIVRVEVSATGAVQVFIDGKAIAAATSNAVTATTALTPAIMVANRSANQVIATVDYIWVQQNR